MTTTTATRTSTTPVLISDANSGSSGSWTVAPHPLVQKACRVKARHPRRSVLFTVGLGTLRSVPRACRVGRS
jgi:hypothetical protein